MRTNYYNTKNELFMAVQNVVNEAIPYDIIHSAFDLLESHHITRDDFDQVMRDLYAIIEPNK